jgi:hypothetical protein
MTLDNEKTKNFDQINSFLKKKSGASIKYKKGKA